MRITILLAGLAACTSSTAPPLEDTGSTPITGTLRLGFSLDGSWTELAAGDPCWVIDGIQGGSWTMPGVRIDGLTPQITLSCELTSSTGELLGETEVRASLAEVDGTLEHEAIAVPVNPGDASLDHLWSTDVALSCGAEDADGGRAAANYELVLEPGYDPEWSVGDPP